MRLALICQMALATLATASPVPREKRAAKPPAFFLAGDSTTAAPSGSGGGWGNGFLQTLKNGATGTNFGHNGATTASFVSGGDWAKVIAAVKASVSTSTPYVTIQFGHNDQKTTSGVTIAQFTTNLENMAKEVTAAGGTPILVTSLSRRKFTNGVVSKDLADVVAATLSAVSALGSAYIDLNAASMAYLNSIGETNAHLYDRIAGDSTHLNSAGETLFGNMVAGLISNSKVGSAVKSYIGENATIAAAIASGKFILPS